MISDFILGLVALYIFSQIRLLSKRWGVFFLFMGLSAIIGAAYHGFSEVGELYRYLSWSLMSVSLVFALLAVYKSINSKILSWLFIFKSAMLLYFAITFTNFNFMVLDTFISLFGFVVIGNALYLKYLSNWISYGILLSFVSVFFIAFKINVHPEYLTFNDLGHYITIFSLLLISKGVKEDALGKILKGSKVTTKS